MHTNTEKSTPERIRNYSQRVYDKIASIAGKPPIMMRPPYGLYEPFQRAKVNLPIIMWTVDTKDWTGKTPSVVLSAIKKDVRPGAIILMHEYLQKHGYLCVTVEDLFAYYHVELEPNHHYAYAVK